MPVQQHHALESVPRGRPHNAAQHASEGGIIQRDGAAEGHVMFGKAGPDTGGDHHALTPVNEPAACLKRHVAAKHNIDAGRQMRTMLFKRSDGHDDKSVADGALAQFLGGQLHPFDFGLHPGPP